MQTSTIQHKASDIDWYCELRGSGPSVVLIPSGEGDCASFAGVADALANDFTVLTFDMPGFSRSGPPPDFGRVTADMLADQVAALVVEPQEVVHGKQESGEGRTMVDGGVRAMPVVVVEPG